MMRWDTARVVVLGGAGFLGSHLCEALLRRRAGVVAVDNFLTGRVENLAHLQHDPGMEVRAADVTHPLRIPGRVDVVFNLASPASPIDYAKLPFETLKVGSLGTEHALVLAEEKGAVFVQASTSEVYGDPLHHPQQETDFGNVNPIGPRSVYDEAKRYGEALVAAFHRHRGLDARIARIFNTYGPRMRLDDGRVIPAFMGQALRGEPLSLFGDGTQTRSFCYVDDLIAGLIRLAEVPGLGPINLGNPVERTMLELVEAFEEVLGQPLKRVHHPLPQDDPKQRRPDITRAREHLGWEPKVELREGLTRTLAWFTDRLVVPEAPAARGVSAPTLH